MTQTDTLTSASSVRYLALLAPCIAQALIALDYAIVYVALPTLAHQLTLSVSEMQWVVSLYGLSFAALLLMGGSLCDKLGARRVFSLGMLGFLLASALGGLASDGSLLLIARGGQGLSAAMLQPAVMALLAQRFHGESHNRALAIWSAIGTLGLISGVMLGGVLTAISWRTIFFINIPPGLIALWFVRKHYQQKRPDSASQPVGIAALVGCGTAGALVWAMMRYAEIGTMDYFANQIAAAMLVLFILHERFATQPLLSRELREIPGLRIGWLSSAFYMASVGSQFYAMTLLWQQTLQLDAVTTGLLFTPLALLIVVGNLIYTHFSKYFTGGQLLMAGFAGAGLGLKLLSVAPYTPLSLSFITGIILSGIGHGIIFPAMFAVGLKKVHLQQQGRASALIITSQYIAGAMTLAVISLFLGIAPDIADWADVFSLLSALAFIGMLVALCADKK
ncbi:MFS transporter [Klebsiella sp. BIGb0407]|uniref:MFS transporter n=1 Tax=Klebsiella sp. BIGb0407 TaxID=2940603 RepID=UPI00216A2739|nr:MFS transporter [Klebsiella sp. BIGb0407]MCS3431011.1 MFS family permease [Klebsiella sp. BIGb0407]